MYCLRLLRPNSSNLIARWKTNGSITHKNIIDENLEMALKNVSPESTKQIAVHVNMYTNGLLPEPLYERRLAAEGTAALNFGNLIVIKWFTESKKFRDLSTILKNCLYYRVFLDYYTCYHLLDALLQDKEYVASVEIALCFMLQDHQENELVTAYLAKTFYEYIKHDLSNSAIGEEFVKPVEALDEKKRRVKYLKNTVLNSDLESIFSQDAIGKAIIMIADKCPQTIKINMKILGLMLCKKYKECLEVLTIEPAELCYETLEICQLLINDKECYFLSILKNAQEKIKKHETLSSKLNNFVIETSTKIEHNIMDDQINKYFKWTEDCRTDVMKEFHIRERAVRLVNIENDLKNLTKKNKELFFFEREDKIDLEIFHKEKIYPKRWFGKQKIPKALDDNYIPPDIITKMGENSKHL